MATKRQPRRAAPAPSVPASATTAGSDRPTLPIPISALLIVAYSLAGIGVAIYLTIVHYAKVSLACPAATNGGKFLGIFPVSVNCTQVTQSGYSVIDHTNIPITVPGLLWFLVSGGLIGLVLYYSRRGNRELTERLISLHLLWALAGLAFIIYLIYAEAVLIKSFCEWCSVVHLMVILTFITVLARWQRMMVGRYGAG